MRVRRSSQLMESDPYTLIVALSTQVTFCHVMECVTSREGVCDVT